QRHGAVRRVRRRLDPPLRQRLGRPVGENAHAKGVRGRRLGGPAATRPLDGKEALMKRKVTTLVAAAAVFAIALVSTACGSTAYSAGGGYGYPIATSPATRAAAAATIGVRPTS